MVLHASWKPSKDGHDGMDCQLKGIALCPEGRYLSHRSQSQNTDK